MTDSVPRSLFRVVHLASGREWRGGQRQVVYLARALAARGIPQGVVTGRGSRLARELASAAIPVLACGWTAALDPRVLLAIRRAVRTAGPPVILHAHDPHALVLAALGAWGHRIPLVVTRRVDFPLRRLWPWRRATRVVAISEAVRRVLVAGGIAADLVTVVPSGIPLDTPPPAPLDLRQRLSLPPTARLAVSVGALVGHKDYSTLIGAAARLRERHPGLHWVLAGDGPEHGFLAELARRLGVDARVHLLGQVDEGRAVIAAGDLFVVSSREEGLNTSVLDARQLGVPVVSTDAGGLPEAVGDAGVLCRRGDANLLAQAVAGLLEDPARQATLRARGRERVTRFSSDRMAEGMLPVYHSVALAT